MTEKLDSGEVIAEEFVDVAGATTVCEVYNRLYPYYAVVVGRALGIFSRR